MKKLALFCVLILLAGCAAPIKVQRYEANTSSKIATFNGHTIGVTSQAYIGKMIASTKIVEMPVGKQVVVWSETQSVFAEYVPGISNNANLNFTCKSITPYVSPVATVSLNSANYYVVPLKCSNYNPYVILVDQETKRVDQSYYFYFDKTSEITRRGPLAYKAPRFLSVTNNSNEHSEKAKTDGGEKILHEEYLKFLQFIKRSGETVIMLQQTKYSDRLGLRLADQKPFFIPCTPGTYQIGSFRLSIIEVNNNGFEYVIL